MRHSGLLLAPAVCAAAAVLGCRTHSPDRHVVRHWRFDPASQAESPGSYARVPVSAEHGGGHAVEAVRTKDGRSLMVQLMVQPPEAVGSPARLAFEHRLEGTNSLTVQIFDVTVQDNRHIVLRDLVPGRWQRAELDFTRDSRRNDGTADVFPAGNPVDDVFFFVHGAPTGARLQVRDVMLWSPAPR
jgi:hypothetical protein